MAPPEFGVGGVFALAIAAAIVIATENGGKKKHKRKCICVRKYVRDRENYGTDSKLIPALHEDNGSVYANFLRIPEFLYHLLLYQVYPVLKRKNTRWRAALSPGERLTVTLCYLATGDKYRSLSYLFPMGESTIACIISETCTAIYNALKKKYMKFPMKPNEWKDVADVFWIRWQMPHCIGVLDSKHVRIRCPNKSGSLYYNYKHTYSIVLMVVADANYRFVYIDVGCQGRLSDRGVFLDSELDKALKRGSSKFPRPDPLPGDEHSIPYFLVGDDAFALQPWLMMPYAHRNKTDAQRIYNYRLCRARRVVENVFGIMTTRFRVLLTTILLYPRNAIKVVLACTALHNMLHHKYATDSIRVNRENLLNGQLPPGDWCHNINMFAANVPQARNPTICAKQQRDYLTQYFNSDIGSVP